MNIFPLFARTGTTSVFGKLDGRVDAFRAEQDVLDAFDRAANRAGKTRVEYLRLVMAVAGFGREHVLRLHRQEIDRVGDLLEGSQLRM